MRLESVRELRARELDRLAEVERPSGLVSMELLQVEAAHVAAPAHMATSATLTADAEPAMPGAPHVALAMVRGAALALAPALSWLRPAVRPRIALGVAPSGNRDDYLLAVRVQDPALLGSTLVEDVCRRAHGEVDLRFIGPCAAAGWSWRPPLGRHRPLRAGVSIGARSGRATGTLGSFVRAGDYGPLQVLSNSHVIADSGRSVAGTAVLQPGWQDRGRELRDRVAVLSKGMPLQSNGINDLDCAVAEVDDGIDCEPQAFPGGALAGAADPQLEDLVAKLGRTSGYTEGRVAAFEVGPVTFRYPIGEIVFDDLIEVHGAGAGPFARHGDSGSLVFRPGDRRAVALVFGLALAGGSNGAGVTYVHPLPAVLQRLAVWLVV